MSAPGCAPSFAYLVYASSYLKRYYPAVFLAALLNNQPMGFYSPQSVIADARRHGGTAARGGRAGCRRQPQCGHSDAGGSCPGRIRSPACPGRSAAGGAARLGVGAKSWHRGCAGDCGRPSLRKALATIEDRTRVLVGGIVTHRQRPPTAGGVVFINLEDETGMVNVVCPRQVWERQRRIALNSAALLIDGRLERNDGAINLVVIRLRRLQVSGNVPSRNFR